MPIFRQKRTTLTFLAQISLKMDLVQEVQQSGSSRYHLCQLSGKMDNFNLFGPNLPKNRFCGRNFKNLSPDSESPLPRYHLYQFSVKMDSFEFFGQNLGKLPSYVRYFGSNDVECVAGSLVKAEMSWVEVDGAAWRLK